MDAHWEFRRRGERRLAAEKNRTFAPSQNAAVLVVPSPYPLAMASLGVLWAYERINAIPNWSCERLFAPDEFQEKPWRTWPHAALCTLETRTPLSEFSLVALSLCAEAEIPRLIRMLLASGITPLRRQRNRNPFVIAGGPLGLVAPYAIGAIADIVFLGDTESTLPVFLERLAAGETVPQNLCADLPGVWAPETSPPVAECVLETKNFGPAVSNLVTPEAEFGEKRLVEVSRGCSRSCAFCMMSRHARPCGMRVFSADAIRTALGETPGSSVGFVGAAVSDHPQLISLVEELVQNNVSVSLSSVRADRASLPLLTALAHGKMRTLTLGLDGASERIRNTINKQCSNDDFLTACENAVTAGLLAVKIYCILGYPDETDTDIEELATLITRIPRQLSIKLSLSALVPKSKTPLANAPFPNARVFSHRIYTLKRLLPFVKIHVPSWKDAKFEYEVDHFQESDMEKMIQHIFHEQ